MDNNKTIQEATTHDLKTWEVYFTAILDGRKRFEIRKNDRGFKKGDYLLLKEWNHITRSFTNRELTVKVDYIIKDAPSFGLADGYCIMSISPLTTHPIATDNQQSIKEEAQEKAKEIIVSFLQHYHKDNPFRENEDNEKAADDFLSIYDMELDKWAASLTTHPIAALISISLDGIAKSIKNNK